MSHSMLCRRLPLLHEGRRDRLPGRRRRARRGREFPRPEIERDLEPRAGGGRVDQRLRRGARPS
jgi:hypothetical protein